MNHKSGYVMLLGLGIGLILAGCNNKKVDGNNTSPDYPVEQDQNQGSTDKSKASDSTIKKLVRLIGEQDKTVVDVMGEGIDWVSDDMKRIVSRKYELTLQENKLSAIVSFHENGTVQGIYCYLPDYDAVKWETALTVEFGKPTRIEDNTLNKEDGNDMLYINWMYEGSLISLFGSNGSLSIQMERVIVKGAYIEYPAITSIK